MLRLFWFFFRGSMPAFFCVLMLRGLVALSYLVQGGFTRCWVYIDTLRSRLILLTLWVVGLRLLATSEGVRVSARWQGTMVVLVVTLVRVFMIKSLLTFYILFEAALLPTFFLVIRWGYQPERLQAGLYLVLYTVVARLPLLAGILSIFSAEGRVSFLFYYGRSPCVGWWVVMLLAFLVKAPLYTLHL